MNLWRVWSGESKPYLNRIDCAVMLLYETRHFKISHVGHGTRAKLYSPRYIFSNAAMSWRRNEWSETCRLFLSQ